MSWQRRGCVVERTFFFFKSSAYAVSSFRTRLAMLLASSFAPVSSSASPGRIRRHRSSSSRNAAGLLNSLSALAVDRAALFFRTSRLRSALRCASAGLSPFPMALPGDLAKASSVNFVDSVAARKELRGSECLSNLLSASTPTSS
jgi:hypothetical protein